MVQPKVVTPLAWILAGILIVNLCLKNLLILLENYRGFSLQAGLNSFSHQFVVVGDHKQKDNKSLSELFIDSVVELRVRKYEKSGRLYSRAAKSE